MFATHQKVIADWALQDPDNLADVTLLAILSARQPFHRVREQFAQVKRDNWSPLFAWKEQAYQEAVECAEWRHTIFHQVIKYLPCLTWTDEDTADVLLWEALKWYGLGFVKGGFVVQMVAGVSGCLDTRNMNDMHLPKRTWRADGFQKLSEKSKEEKIRAYNHTVSQIGSQQLWDMWCNNYATSSDKFDTGWDVSAEHCRILGLDPGEPPEDIPF